MDAEARKVSLNGKADFSGRTDQSWNEVVTYSLDCDAEGKIKEYEIWADIGAAYLASRRLFGPGKVWKEFPARNEEYQSQDFGFTRKD